jgi:hypothetical protein
MLHARALGFSHPKTGEPVRAVSPIPADFSGVLEKLRRRRTKIPGPESRHPSTPGGELRIENGN